MYSGQNLSLQVQSGGDVDVERGDLIFSTAGKGIVLGATSNTAANTLDDYEEGTHTATLTMGSGTAALSVDQLSYTKVGRLVTLQGQIRVGTVSSPSGTLKISLPFSAIGGETGYGVGTYRSYQIDTPNDGVNAIIASDTGTAYAFLAWSRDSATDTPERATENGYFMLGLTYMAA